MDSLIKYVVFVLFSVLVLIAVDHSAAGHPAATQEEAKIDAAVEDLQKLMQSKESKITNRDGYLEGFGITSILNSIFNGTSKIVQQVSSFMTTDKGRSDSATDQSAAKPT